MSKEVGEMVRSRDVVQAEGSARTEGARRLVTKVVQLERDSRFESSTPRIWRQPSPLIPIAMKTACDWITPSSRTFSYRASRIR